MYPELGRLLDLLKHEKKEEKLTDSERKLLREMAYFIGSKGPRQYPLVLLLKSVYRDVETFNSVTRWHCTNI
jgi:hypothetical protein